MNKDNRIRVLVNSDLETSEFIKFVNSNYFDIDDRNIKTIGLEDSADILSEYDSIILNFSKPVSINPIRYYQLVNFLNDYEKTLIILMHKHQEIEHQSTTIVIGGIFNLLNIDSDKIDIINKGKEFTLTEEGKKCVFKKYLNSNSKDWKISFRSNTYKLIPLALNRDNNIISFSLDVKANNYFLPFLANDEITFWEIINGILQNKFSTPFKTDKWVEDYSFHNLKETISEIDKIQTEINILEEKKENLENERNHFEIIRNVLLNLDGNILSEVCKEVLELLGLKIHGVDLGREDLVFIHNSRFYVIEVKGSIKSASKENVRQLSSHLTEFKNEKEVEPKGILLINAWRELPLEERDTKDKPIFPHSIMNLVTLTNISLITTQQLFVAYCDNLEGKFDLEEFMKKIDSASGVMDGYNDIEKYKVKIDYEVEKSKD